MALDIDSICKPSFGLNLYHVSHGREYSAKGACTTNQWMPPSKREVVKKAYNSKIVINWSSDL